MFFFFFLNKKNFWGPLVNLPTKKNISFIAKIINNKKIKREQDLPYSTMQNTSSTKKTEFNPLSNQITLLTGKNINPEMNEAVMLDKKFLRKQAEFRSSVLSNLSFSSSSFFNSKLSSTGLVRREEGGGGKEERGGGMDGGENEGEGGGRREEGGGRREEGGGRRKENGRVGRMKEGGGLKNEDGGRREQDGRRKEQDGGRRVGGVWKEEEARRREEEARREGGRWEARMNEKGGMMEGKAGSGNDGGGRIEGFKKKSDLCFGGPFQDCGNVRISLDSGLEEYGRRMQKRLYINILDN